MKQLIDLGVTSIVHSYKNLKFEVLFILFVLTHLFKNIWNNWCTEKTQTLELQNPQTKELNRKT